MMWAMLTTQPDIAHAIRLLLKSMQNPGKAHCTAAKYCLRYLAGTRKHGITYRCSKTMDPIGYTDTGWASSTDDRRSILAFVFTMAGGVVSWSFKRQLIVTLSTAEAEYMAVSHYAKEARWL